MKAFGMFGIAKKMAASVLAAVSLYVGGAPPTASRANRWESFTKPDASHRCVAMDERDATKARNQRRNKRAHGLCR